MDVPEAEYLISKGMDNGFKTNNEFYRIKEKYSAGTVSPHICWITAEAGDSTTLYISV